MTIFNKFAKYALSFPETSIYDVYNDFASSGLITEQERQFVSDHFMLMLKVGEAARGTIPSVQKMLS